MKGRNCSSQGCSCFSENHSEDSSSGNLTTGSEDVSNTAIGRDVSVWREGSPGLR